MKVYPLECGRLTAPVELMEEGPTGPRTMPVMAFLLVHPDGRMALFDAGLLPEMDGKLFSDAFQLSLPPGEDVASRLQAMDVDPDRVDRLVLSHSHFDHVAGAALIANADLVIHAAELEAALEEAPKDYARRTLDLGHRRICTGDSFDLFGDGSAEVFATPGHTCGHQSLRVRRRSGWDVLAGDACYFCATLVDEGVQPYADDKVVYLDTLRRLKAMGEAGDLIVPGHDLGFLENLPAGTTLQASATAATG
ncbi:N-acyl homoserine lactonase family protein [Phenylobacterium sp.]|uniref:N-acyl homoserine lactonase family protein n=1 Tax=Phenylobacterium sp. TaxID=1871053 RepID=UPI00286ADE89|nr:N-acyl homoserine lactonase family protein [Phenylobacterium sp.]